MFLLDSGKVAGDVANADKVIRGILEKNQAEVLVCRPWDERRLAYPIKNQKKGLYFLTYFTADGTTLTTIERDCALTEMILRMLMLKIHPKLVKTMLTVAQGEHASALHNYQDQPSDEGMPMRSGGGDRGR
jgi:small subunit ribosomal protein S6